MIINNVEIKDLEIFDADVSEKYENEMVKVQEISEKAGAEFKSGKIKQSEYIRKLCTAVNDFIDSMWEVGTAFKVFNGKCNMITSIKTFAEIVDWANDKEQHKEEFAVVDNIVSKYSPNRAARRSKK